MYIFIVCKFHINKTDLKWKWDSEKAEILMGVISNLQKMILIHSGGWKLEVMSGFLWPWPEHGERGAGGLINQNVISQECIYSVFSPLPPSVYDAPGVAAFLVQFFFFFWTIK